MDDKTRNLLQTILKQLEPVEKAAIAPPGHANYMTKVGMANVVTAVRFRIERALGVIRQVEEMEAKS